MIDKPEALLYHPVKLYIPWQCNGFSEGEIAVIIKDRGQEIEIWNENLSKEEVEQILLAFVRKVIHNGKMMEFRKD